jgi:L-2-hydroxyglutarate oxidase LhgO
MSADVETIVVGAGVVGLAVTWTVGKVWPLRIAHAPDGSVKKNA